MNNKMMLRQFQTALDLIYPPTCLSCAQPVGDVAALCGSCWRETAFIGGTICDACGIALPGGAPDEIAHCDSCLAHPPPWSQGRAALAYRDVGRKLVLALKHGDRQEIARPAARWMARVLPPNLPPDTLIAPVPLHWTRLAERRFNQSALLARVLSRETGLAWCPDLLKRLRKTRSLEGTSRAERFAILEGAIGVHPKRGHLLAGRPVLLVDDVMTSGATLWAAAQACSQGGADAIYVVTLARVGKDA